MTLRPLQDRVLVRRAEPEAKTVGGIFIPDTIQEKPLEGVIVAAGPGARGKGGELMPMTVQAGDRVLFNKWAGAEITLQGEELTIMNESEIIGVFSRAGAEQKAA
jgi:chaperonin GroES